MSPHEAFRFIDINVFCCYFATRSNHLSITSIVNIEIEQATTKIVHVNQIGIA